VSLRLLWAKIIEAILEPMTFEIRIPQFEGPFDLLLFFIERDELDIHQISIAAIADEFLSYLQEMVTLNMEVASEFIVVAATLMRIKARLLIPARIVNIDQVEDDPEQSLLQRLLVLKRYKDVLPQLTGLVEQRSLQEKRGSVHTDLMRLVVTSRSKDELVTLNLFKLLERWVLVQEKLGFKPIQDIYSLNKHQYSLEEQKATIMSLLLISQRLQFNVLQITAHNKVHLVYKFLALLELLQEQLLNIESGTGFNNFSVSLK